MFLPKKRERFVDRILQHLDPHIEKGSLERHRFLSTVYVNATTNTDGETAGQEGLEEQA